jgi:hypothetical protein
VQLEAVVGWEHLEPYFVLVATVREIQSNYDPSFLLVIGVGKNHNQFRVASPRMKVLLHFRANDQEEKNMMIFKNVGDCSWQSNTFCWILQEPVDLLFSE